MMPNDVADAYVRQESSKKKNSKDILRVGVSSDRREKIVQDEKYAAPVEMSCQNTTCFIKRELILMRTPFWNVTKKGYHHFCKSFLLLSGGNSNSIRIFYRIFEQLKNVD